MRTRIIEATQGPAGLNWGKFMVGRFDEAEWQHRSVVDPPKPLLKQIGTDPEAVWVFDLQTCEAASFRPGGLARADLNKHRVWVCVLFEDFLEWLYTQDLTDLDALPGLVHLPDAEGGLYGHRRPGPEGSKP